MVLTRLMAGMTVALTLCVSGLMSFQTSRLYGFQQIIKRIFFECFQRKFIVSGNKDNGSVNVLGQAYWTISNPLMQGI